jgi:thioredoxin 1
MSTKIVYVSEVNGQNFEEFTKTEGIVVVDIWAKWCGPCMVLSPIIDQLAADFTEEGSSVKVAKMDADSNRDKVIDLGITSIPTILIYKDGEQVDRHTGAIPKEKLREMIKKHI